MDEGAHDEGMRTEDRTVDLVIGRSVKALCAIRGVTLVDAAEATGISRGGLFAKVKGDTKFAAWRTSPSGSRSADPRTHESAPRPEGQGAFSCRRSQSRASDGTGRTAPQ